jgi:hypothetical protein
LPTSALDVRCVTQNLDAEAFARAYSLDIVSSFVASKLATRTRALQPPADLPLQCYIGENDFILMVCIVGGQSQTKFTKNAQWYVFKDQRILRCCRPCVLTSRLTGLLSARIVFSCAQSVHPQARFHCALRRCWEKEEHQHS